MKRMVSLLWLPVFLLMALWPMAVNSEMSRPVAHQHLTVAPMQIAPTGTMTAYAYLPLLVNQAADSPMPTTMTPPATERPATMTPPATELPATMTPTATELPATMTPTLPVPATETPPSDEHVTPGSCLTPEEAELVNLLNQYRNQQGLPDIPASKSLSTVGQWHVIDLSQNQPNVGQCNTHSWSDAHPDLWSAVCYTPDHAQAEGMWDKPREITAGVYDSSGFEIGASFTSGMTPAKAVSIWQESSAHRQVILEQGIWEDSNWQAMGVGLYGQYAVTWFGRMADPQGTITVCSNN